MKTLIKEPLVQFVIAGAVLFLVIHYFPLNQTGGQSAYDITVNDDTLMQYAQTQAKRFNADSAGQYIKSLSDEEKEHLSGEFVRDEVLYREALALGLDKNDVVIRRRLIQKMKYVAQGFYNDQLEPDESDLETYLQQNHEKYRIAAAASFTHVFFSGKKHGDKALLRARQELVKLNGSKVPFEQAGRFGDRYLYNLNYIDRTEELVGSHFGAGFQEALFYLNPGNHWQGPLRSDYGYHLIYLKQKTPSRLPKLHEVAHVVLPDAKRDLLNSREREAVLALENKYTILKTADNQ